MARRKKVDNSIASVKIWVRLQAVKHLPRTARVLEFFTGDGVMHEFCWSHFAGATIDKDSKKSAIAASERPTWAVYEGETEASIGGGWMSHVPWDVIDIDAYGSPWPFLLAWARSDRARARETVIVLTDGIMSRSAIVRCKVLNQSSDGCSHLGSVTREGYMSQVNARLAIWGRECGLDFGEVKTYTGRGWRGVLMAQHVLTARDKRQCQPDDEAS